MDEQARRVLAAQRKRRIADVMGFIDREINPHLDEKAREELRRRVMASIDGLADLATDLLRTYTDERYVVNTVVLERLDALAKILEDGRG